MIKYQPIHSFTSDEIAHDIFDAGLQNVTFYCLTYRPTGWTELMRDFNKSGDIELAHKIIGGILVKIEQGEDTYPIATPEQAKELQASIERQAPGHGEDFIRNLTYALFDQQLKAEGIRLGNLSEPLPASENGNGKKQKKSAEKA